MSRIAEAAYGDAPLSYPAAPGFKEPTTSRDVALVIAANAAFLRDRILAVIAGSGVRGLTPDEAATILEESVLAIRPRFSELGPKHAGKIVKTGERRANKSGLKANAWRIA
jgi:hypothetical protein